MSNFEVIKNYETTRGTQEEQEPVEVADSGEIVDATTKQDVTEKAAAIREAVRVHGEVGRIAISIKSTVASRFGFGVFPPVLALDEDVILSGIYIKHCNAQFYAACQTYATTEKIAMHISAMEAWCKALEEILISAEAKKAAAAADEFVERRSGQRRVSSQKIEGESRRGPEGGRRKVIINEQKTLAGNAKIEA